MSKLGILIKFIFEKIDIVLIRFQVKDKLNKVYFLKSFLNDQH